MRRRAEARRRAARRRASGRRSSLRAVAEIDPVRAVLRSSGSLTGPELDTLTVIAALSNPALPRCGGLLVVHADGCVGCSDAGCPGLRHAYHPPGSTAACDAAQALEVERSGHRCERCA